ncbi:MAG: InlB B-repeat-containing protein, partial [Butyrivibrio sp.]|nr:InlB B-repeat-containing protein [Butyrivibrio sp.]
MKKTGTISLSFILIFMMMITNLAGVYHTAGRVYAAEETDGGAENTDGSTQDGDETALTNATLPTGDVTQSGDQVSAITQPQETVPENTFTVTFDANGHGTAPDAVTVTEGSTIAKPDDLSAEGFTFHGWFCDLAAMVAWDFDTHTVTENLTLYAGWTENPPAPTQQSYAENTPSTAQEGATTSDAGNTASTTQNNESTSDTGNTASTTQGDTTTSDAGNTASTTQDDTTTSDAGNTASTAQDDESTSDAGNTASTAQNNESTSDAGNTASTAAGEENKTTFTVTFDVNGHGEAPDKITAESETTIKEPAAPKEDGFAFTGWYRDKDTADTSATDEETAEKEKWDFENDIVTKDMTLYAGWKENEAANKRLRSPLRGPAAQSAERIRFTLTNISAASGTSAWVSGDTGKADATVFPLESGVSQDVTWTSSDDSLATIDNNGNITITISDDTGTPAQVTFTAT